MIRLVIRVFMLGLKDLLILLWFVVVGLEVNVSFNIKPEGFTDSVLVCGSWIRVVKQVLTLGWKDL